VARVSSLLSADQSDVLNNLGLESLNSAELDAVLSNLSVPVLDKIPHIIDKVGDS
jgi:hypothetical protein